MKDNIFVWFLTQSADNLSRYFFKKSSAGGFSHHHSAFRVAAIFLVCVSLLCGKRRVKLDRLYAQKYTEILAQKFSEDKGAQNQI